MTLEVVVVGRPEQLARHATDGDDGKVALGWFDLDGFGAVEFVALFAQEMTHGCGAVEPDAVVEIDDVERPFRLLRGGRQVDGVGGGIAQEDARDIKEAECFARLPDLSSDSFHRRGGCGESDTQPRERIGRRGRTLFAGWGGKVFAVRRAAEVLAGAGRRATLPWSRFAAAVGRAGFARGARFTKFTLFARGRRRVLGPGGTEIKGAEIQRRGVFGHEHYAAGGAAGELFGDDILVRHTRREHG